MTSYPRLILQFAAATAITGLLSITAPAVAAENTAVSAAIAKSTTPVVKRHASRWIRTAWYRHHHYASRVNPIAPHLGCSGEWCGRQFVLMVGIGF
jgi:3-dehydroquinate dehydratase